MAPEVAARLGGYREEGRLSYRGRRGGPDRPRAACEVELPALPDTLFADAVVNCTGPMTDLSRSTDPLLRALVRRGAADARPAAARCLVHTSGWVLDVSGQSCRGSTSSARPARAPFGRPPPSRSPGPGRRARAEPAGAGAAGCKFGCHASARSRFLGAFLLNSALRRVCHRNVYGFVVETL